MATSLVEVAFFCCYTPPISVFRIFFQKKNYKNSCITKNIVVDLYWKNETNRWYNIVTFL